MEPNNEIFGRFGAYQIIRPLGQGGMARVYLAAHPEYDRVAVKVLHQHLVKRPDVLHRFWREMRLADKLQHRRIVNVVDAGVENDRFFLAMQYVEGSSLFEYEREVGPLPIPEAIRMMKEILGALQHAHDAQMVHRDLKPENILLDRNRTAYVSDFGIAKHLEGTKLTRTGTAVGTPYYMAPEQIRNAKEVGPAADIYSAGILLYEMVTGSVPYNAADPMAVAHHHIHGTPVAPSSLREGLPPELELVILKAMEKKPADRFPSAETMVRALDLVERGEKTGISLVSPVDYRGQGMRVGPLALLVAGAFFIALLVVRPDFAVRIREGVLGAVGGAAPGAPPVPAASGSPRGATGLGAGPPAGAPPTPAASTGVVPAAPRAVDPAKLAEYIDGGRWAEARLAAQVAGRAGEVFTDRWAARIRKLLDAGDDAAAQAAVAEFRKAYPRVLWGPFLAGEAALSSGRQEEAARLFSEGFRLAPKSQVESFFERYRPALRDLGPDAREVLRDELHRIARLRGDVGELDEALMLLRQSSRIVEDADTHRRIADLYRRQGRRAKAGWHAKRAASLELGG